jgi:hypothetical protein
MNLEKDAIRAGYKYYYAEEEASPNMRRSVPLARGLKGIEESPVDYGI